MNDESGILATQTEAMLTELRRHQVEQVNKLIDNAQQRAEETIHEAHRNARRTMHEAIVTERRRLKRSSIMADAALQTRQRLQREAKAKLLLQRAWQHLPEVLRRHWEDARGRQQWCEALLDEAVLMFGTADLLVEHPPTLSAEEKNSLRTIAQNRGLEATFAAGDSLSCGLTVSFKGALLDGTVDGLLADRRYIEACLLDEINGVSQEEGGDQKIAEAKSHA